MDTTAILCETCGYALRGLPRTAACPECGRPAVDSLPERRVGSPWQRRPGLRSLLVTHWVTLRRPRPTMGLIRVDGRGAWSLLTANTLVAGALVVFPLAGVLVGDPIRSARLDPQRSPWLTTLWAAPLEVVGVAAVLAALTGLEWIGITAVARRRGWRLSPAAAWQVCAHASVGWIVAALLLWAGLLAWFNVSLLGLASGPQRRLPFLYPEALPALGFLAGLVVFESLVYVGMRRCRFANRPDGADRAPA